MRSAISFFLVIFTAVLASCSGEVADLPGVSSDISLSVMPPAATIARGGTVAFSASISGQSSAQPGAVTWSVMEPNGGTVDASGHYTAPQASGTFHVVAASASDSRRRAVATVTVESSVVVMVTPKNASVTVGGTVSFTASVSGTDPGDPTAVTWSVQENGGGTIDGSGN